MKFKVGDKVLVTSGKDKGKKSEIIKILPKSNTVVVKDVNVYTKHVKPIGERSGEVVRRERPMSVAKVAILNEKGNPDRIGYKVTKSGVKDRIFKKTSTVISTVHKVDSSHKKK